MVKKVPVEILKGLDYRLNPEIEVSESNWKEFRNSEAIRQYPVGTVIQCGQSWASDPSYDNFFKVKNITHTGILVTDVLSLDEVARNCDQGGGWIDYDSKSAKISGDEVRFFPYLNFRSYVVKPNDKKTGRSAIWALVYFINWYGSKDSGYHSLMRLKPGKNGLVRAVIGGLP